MSVIERSEPLFEDRYARFGDAAARAAAAAPEIRPGDDIALNIQRMYGGFPAWLAEHRAGQERGAA